MKMMKKLDMEQGRMEAGTEVGRDESYTCR